VLTVIVIGSVIEELGMSIPTRRCKQDLDYHVPVLPFVVSSVIEPNDAPPGSTFSQVKSTPETIVPAKMTIVVSHQLHHALTAFLPD
jgi:hypothetical protein